MKPASEANEQRVEEEGVPSALPKRRLWPVVVVFFAIAGAVSFFVWRMARAPQPLRVLVAVDVDGYWWEGSKAAAALSDKLGGRLAALGFDVVKAGDPEVTKVLEKAKTPEEAARALHAAFVITARIVPEVIEHAIPDGKYYETRGAADVSVRHIDREPVVAGKIATFAGAKGDKARSVEGLSGSLADQAFDVVLPKIMGDPSIVEVLADRQSNIAPAIFPARDYLLAREERNKHAKESWEGLRTEHLAKENGKNKPTYLSPPGAHDELAGVTKEGPLASTNDVRPFFLPDRKVLGWINELETVEVRGGANYFRGYNIYGYPGCAPEGSPVVLVEDLFGWAKTITVINGKESKRLRVDPEHRFLDPRVSPGGKHIGIYDRPCATCAGDVMVIDATGKELHRVAAESGIVSGFTWLDATHLAYVFTAKGDPDAEKAPQPELRIVDVTTQAVESLELPKGERYGMPTASPKGDMIAFERVDGQKAIALFHRATKTFSAREIPGWARAPSWSPDGTSLAFELSDGGKADIAVAKIDGGVVHKLTQNPYRDRYPLFSLDGNTIYYETVDDDPNWPEHRTVSWIASVPANP
ncbi:MAG: hypothetical protein ACXVEE_01235 [Polyangiales bacterium]